MIQIDKFGVTHVNEDDVCDLLYENPNLDFSLLQVNDPECYNTVVSDTYAGFATLSKYAESSLDINEFDRANQSNWYMPEEYKTLDIARWILLQCHNEAELQRAGQELLLFQERNLFPLLCYLKYIVDTFRENNVIWGVGRGSSIASFILFVIGVHRINPIYYDIPITEFLKEK